MIKRPKIEPKYYAAGVRSGAWIRLLSFSRFFPNLAEEDARIRLQKNPRPHSGCIEVIRIDEETLHRALPVVQDGEEYYHPVEELATLPPVSEHIFDHRVAWMNEAAALPEEA